MVLRKICDPTRTEKSGLSYANRSPGVLTVLEDESKRRPEKVFHGDLRPRESLAKVRPYVVVYDVYK